MDVARYLGIDFGRRRIGLAIGDDELRIAAPLEQLTAAGAVDRDAAAVAAVARRESVGALVVGLPIHMNGALGAEAQEVRRFAAALRLVWSGAIHEQDERLTSVAADEALAAGGLGRDARRARRDMLAAAAMLQMFLDGMPRQ
ncbi:MAG: Holliday junction resolvase RuvX [Phycisphaerae bacterium]